MWKASAGKPMEIKTPKIDGNDDDWETDPDFINDVDEQEQRWGSKTVEGSGRQMAAIDMKQLRQETEDAEAARKKKQRDEDAANPSYGYGGKFGIQADRMDQSAVGHDYVAKLEKHVSQKDYSTGFGGKYGVQTDRIDKSAENWDYKEKIEKHASQKDYTTGFGGKYGVQVDRQDKSAVGWDHVEKVDKHESQKDYSVGFGGKFGVQADRQDKSAVGWDHHEKLQHHESQTDHKKGFGGKFGVQTDRMDKSALTFTEQPKNVGTAYSKTKPDIGAAKPSDVRAKFENMMKSDPPTKPEPEKKVATGGKLDSSKTAMFTNPTAAAPLPKISPVRNSPLVNKLAEKVQEVKIEEKVILQEDQINSNPVEKKVTGKLDASKTAMFTNSTPIPKSPVKKSLLLNKFEQTVQEELVIPKPMVEQTVQEEVKIQEVIIPERQVAEEIQPEVKIEEQFIPQKVVEESVVSKIDEIAISQRNIDEVVAALANFEEQGVAQTKKLEKVVVDDSHNQVVETPGSEEVVVTDEVAELEDTGLVAVALFDYQSAADDEISFDPEDVITHVEMIDEGWWRGLCQGKYGLFPANYVQLINKD